jgi:hypothetical protein
MRYIFKEGSELTCHSNINIATATVSVTPEPGISLFCFSDCGSAWEYNLGLAVSDSSQIDLSCAHYPFLPRLSVLPRVEGLSQAGIPHPL